MDLISKHLLWYQINPIFIWQIWVCDPGTPNILNNPKYIEKIVRPSKSPTYIASPAHQPTITEIPPV
jgi:hypothetical protein